MTVVLLASSEPASPAPPDLQVAACVEGVCILKGSPTRASREWPRAQHAFMLLAASHGI